MKSVGNFTGRMVGGLGLWNVYFICKFFLTQLGYLRLELFANIALFCFLLLPANSKGMRVLKQLIALGCGIALLWSESWLPGPQSIMANATGITGFSVNYVLQLIWDFINWRMVFAGCAILLIYYAARDFIRVTAVTGCWLLFLVVSPFFGSAPSQQSNLVPQTATGKTAVGNPTDTAAALAAAKGTSQGEASSEEIDKWYQTFIAYEKDRVAKFPDSIKPKDTPFDIVILNICSLSTDDLIAANLINNRTFSQFNIRFDHFNSATSYSGPAALRLLNGACGQPSHDALYDTRRLECEIMNRLDSLGFKQHLFLDHSGVYDNYLNAMRTQAGLTAPFERRRYPVKYVSFNNEEIADTLSVFRHWRSVVNKAKDPRSVSLFNFIALHDGNRQPGKSRWEEFEPRARAFIDALDVFIADLQKSKRKVMLIIVPEHGAAVRGDRIQTPRLRDIPSRRITQVPVMVKFFGLNKLPKTPVHVTSDTSYLALSTLIGRVIETNYFSKPEGAVPIADLVNDLPTTHMVSENAQAMVLEYKGKDYLKMSKGQWRLYDAD